MFKENHEVLPPVTSSQTQAHTVEILFTTAALLVLFVAVYLTFFDNWSVL